MLSSNDIRGKFLKFFASKQHKIIASDSVVPKDDPTVLFTTAGMQQFKRQFLGNIDDFTRATTSQKCIRTDDLDEVGQTNFHHTFFEMLGNFSFGDYFKKDAICWGWEFLTKEVGIDKDRLWISVYYDDQEAYDIWKNEIGIPEHKIFKLGDKSNFWPSDAKKNGPNGPCGPCSEIFFDYDPSDTTIPRDPDDIDGRFAEIWNLVFTQFERKDGGELVPLPGKNIDTGMGLERLCAVIQGVTSNFETDLFVPIIEAIDKEIPAKLSVKEKRIIADHIRAATFAINDGIIPSNKERGSIVKSLINRAANIVFSFHGPDVGAQVYKLVPTIAQIMGKQYPELLEKVDAISALIRKTEEAFAKVLEETIPKLEKLLYENKGFTDNELAEIIGDILFVFHTTHGLPVTTSLAIIKKPAFMIENSDIKNALNVYYSKMDEHRIKSRVGSKMTGDVFVDMDLDLNVPKTEFLGYDTFESDATVLRIFKGQESIEKTQTGDEVRIVLDKTPFYAESGGQIGDTGIFTNTDTNTDTNTVATITDTQKLDNIFLHSATIASELSVGDTITASVNNERRMAIMRNHTATHLLQAALRKVLGEHVQQQGSIVDENRLRFDFTHPKGLTNFQKTAVEEKVADMIAQDVKVDKDEMTMDEARKKGALAFFAEKYGEKVRVIHIDGCSTELCGGTHLDNTGEIKLLKISSEGAIAQGIRRIEAVTGDNAEAFIKLQKQREKEAKENLEKKKHQKQTKETTFTIHKTLHFDYIIKDADNVNNVKIISHIYDDKDIDINTMRNLSDIAKQKAKSAAIIFGVKSDDTASMIVAITDDLVKQGIKADDIIKESAPIMNGRGGGKPQFAQAGGKNVSKLNNAIEKAKNIVIEKLKNL